jgi:leader peptidase (prepilin peptidase)/N-methyltransferase
VVELLTAIVFVAAFHRYGGIAFEGSWVFWVRDLPVWAALLASVFIDLDHRIIPDEISFGVLGYSLLLSYFVPSLGISQSVLGAVLGFGIFYGIAWFYFRRTGRSGMGGGDIKLLAAIGAFLGPIGVLTTIMVSSILGSVIGILWGLYEGRKKSSEDGTLMKTSIPFGPFLVLGAWVYYLLGDRLWHPFQNL